MKADQKHRKTQTKNLCKKPGKNKGITSGKEFSTEKKFQEYFKEFLKGRKLYREGYRQETQETGKWTKKEEAKITEVETEPSRESGFGDIAIHHDFINLSWNHALSNPFIIELKNKKSFRHAIDQAVRYKTNSSSKFQEKGKYKFLNTGIATPQSLSTGEIASQHNADQVLATNFEAKRIYWKLGIGVIQSIKPEEVVVSFNEGDKLVIK